jgi:hypothetical protein
MELRRRTPLLAIMTLLVLGCGDVGLYTKSPALPAPSIASQIGAKVVTEFALGSSYPTGLTLSDAPGLEHTIFLISFDGPAGLMAIDVSTMPFRISPLFQGCLVPTSVGIPAGGLEMLSPTRAFFLTSSHLIDCNPTSGIVYGATPLGNPVTLDAPAPLSRPYDLDGNGTLDATTETVHPTYPADLAVIDDRLFVSVSNYIVPTGDPVAAPGLVLTFDLTTAPPTRIGAPHLTAGFNPSGLTPLRDGRLIVTISGVNTILGAGTIPITDSGVEVWSPSSDTSTWINLGPVALSFQPPAISSDEQFLFVTSASYGELYVIDLGSNTVLHGHDDPLQITGSTMGADFLPQAALDPTNTFLFVASFAQSAIYPVQVDVTPMTVLPSALQSPIRLGYASGVSQNNPSGANTGIGGLAIAPDAELTEGYGRLYALTANPGKLVAIDLSPDITGTPALSAPPHEPEPDTNTPQTPAGPTREIYRYELVRADSDRDVDADNDDDTIIVELVPFDPPPGDPRVFPDAVTAFLPGAGAGYGASPADFPANILGPPRESTASGESVLSLGCHGTITLEMQDLWIADGPGADFIVFENPFPGWVEPGIVGVSMDGTTFHDFPCNVAKSPYTGCAGVTPTLASSDNNIDPSDPALAGGDAFDLSDIGLAFARFVRVRDTQCNNLGGTTTGFDLDAITIIWGDDPQ